jgi:hypothetical protein
VGGALVVSSWLPDVFPSSFRLERCTFGANSAYRAGEMTDCTFEDHQSSLHAGAVETSYVDLVVHGGSFDRNSSANGGAVWMYQSDITFDAVDFGTGADANLPNDLGGTDERSGLGPARSLVCDPTGCG